MDGNLDNNGGAGNGELFKPKQYAVLYVDDELPSLNQFAKAFEQEFWVLTAPSVRAALGILQKHRGEVGVLLTDLNMPGQKGLCLLKQARESDPLVIRILATASCDWSAVMEAMEIGLFSFIPLPWEPAQLPHLLRRALLLYALQRQVLHQHTLDNADSADYIERLNTLRDRFGDPDLPGTLQALKLVIPGEADKKRNPPQGPSSK